MSKALSDPVKKITDFIREAGLEVRFTTLPAESPLPGLTMQDGELLVDPEKLVFPGDLLHEAGHLAPFPATVRKQMSGRLAATDQHLAGEIMAFAWSYAACLHLQLDPAVVFHDGGYRGGSTHVIDNFSKGHIPGIPLLEWYGLTFTEETAADLGEKPYPHMIKWVNDQEYMPGEAG